MKIQERLVWEVLARVRVPVWKAAKRMNVPRDIAVQELAAAYQRNELRLVGTSRKKNLGLQETFYAEYHQR